MVASFVPFLRRTAKPFRGGADQRNLFRCRIRVGRGDFFVSVYIILQKAVVFYIIFSFFWDFLRKIEKKIEIFLKRGVKVCPVKGESSETDAE